MKKRVLSSLVVLCMATVLFTACGKTEKVIEPVEEMWPEVTPAPTEAPTPEPTKEPTEEPTPEPTEEPTKEAAQAPFADAPTYNEIQLRIANLCNLDIPGLAIQNPMTEEWVLIGGVPTSQIMTVTFSWPDNENSMNIRVYNNLGEEYMTTKVDVKGLENSVTITLTGENEIASVDAVVE
ncbi:hypothetical protein SAMN02910368_01319 [Lachnospiraceae bacterium G11]|nr:hypothetical protein SAMN02910368_01319 [Lachnospiraceae bacterium G11]